MDIEHQAGTAGLQYAADKGLAVVIMEGLRGGMLTGQIPPSVQQIWDNAPVQRTPAEWALQWLWNQPEVSVVLSGMTTMEQVVENVESTSRSGVNTMTAGELAVVDRIRDQYNALCAIPCTHCEYCRVPPGCCPNNVAIPDIFEIYNDLIMYGDNGRARLFYSWIEEGNRAQACIECGECLEKCPQHIEIPEWLKKVHEVLCQEEASAA